ncbi:MAG: tetratricopeptide (TPR) repeat protein [Planctomycetota bacterium]
MGLILALVLGLLMRAGYLAERSAQPDFEQPVVDAGYHDYWARIQAGLPAQQPEGKLDPELGQHPCLRPPLYPWFLGGVYSLTDGSYMAPRVVQHGLGMLAILMVWSLARRRLGTRGAGLAAGLFAVHWAPIYFEGELHAPALVIPLLLACMAGALGAAEAKASRARLWLAGLAGFSGGLAVLARPNMLFALAALGLWLGLHMRRRGAAAIAIFVVGAGLGIAPATVRNLSASGEAVLVTSSGGINLYLGNRPQATSFIDDDLSELGLGPFKTCFDYPAIVAGLSQQQGRELSHTEVDQFFRERAMDSIGADFGGFLGRTMNKALIFFGPSEVGHNKEVSLEHQRSKVLRWSPSGWFPVLLFLALVGGAGALVPGTERGRRDLLRVGLFVVLAWSLSVVPFFAAARYRVPLLPVLCLLAGSGLDELLGRQWGRARLGLRVGVALLLTLAVSLAAAPLVPAPSEVKWHLDRGRGYFDGGDMDAARVEFEAAIEVDPSSAGAWFELAITEHKQGQLDAAVAAYGRVLERQPTHHLAAFNLGSMAEQAGQAAQAARLYVQALTGEPQMEPALAGLGRVSLKLATHPDAARRDGPLAERGARLILERRGPTDPGGLFLLAATRAEQSDFQGALEALLLLRKAGSAPAQMGPAIENAQRRYAAGQPMRTPR